jgi:prepilin-type N-terminal cleavage/methylation domain-containing protein
MKKNTKTKINSGFSLIETMIVLVVFATIALITSQALISTLSLSAKAKSTAKVRQEIDYALSIMERHLHNSSALVNCPNTDKKKLQYQDALGATTTFSCESVNNDNFIASGSARLTSELISVTSCNLDCYPASGATPGYVKITLNAVEKTRSGKETGQIDVSTLIHLRSN